MTISNGELMGDLLVGAVAIKMIDSTNNNHQPSRKKVNREATLKTLLTNNLVESAFLR